MTDAPLFAPTEPVFPRRVSGRFRRLKWAVMIATLGVYYVTPWLRWDRGPDMPDQAVLVDLAGRRFHFFFVEIWPHEFYVVAGLLVMAGLGLFLFTSALGRVWCGYACPQTVWTDLFLAVERWIEGDRNARVRLWRAPWDARKWRLRLAKWAVWTVIGLLTGGAWVFYFADAPTLLRDLLTGAAHPVAYASVAVLTATTVVLGGFMREQVCIYMCPWPRIQGAMMDERTLTVGYRDWRGEPRGKQRDPVAGDCIDCRACVNVCPMGIDIREGQQLACITCALCIDACDDVMERIGRPRGLVDYLALEDRPPEGAAADWSPRPLREHVLRPRTVIYTALWSLIGVGIVAALALRPEIGLSVAPVRNPVSVTLSDGAIRNAYDIRLRNKHGEARAMRLAVEADAPLALALEGRMGNETVVPADATLHQRAYVTAASGSPAAAAARTALRIRVTDPVSGESAAASTLFHGKEDAHVPTTDRP
ncbi:cytochrome c oxidase accessory protein CcoG [Jannaschia sp. W003]|uniref:cytochrome c oxidase accessory protein CcoG n=1 Tax=Jannaschia sp. W003 TaxID=2867012 RepID=UPI0021A6FE18|nr:cytochrome c oxidase accessory protein CcoG [Jannaschia sp. W003]UWQ22424.1 cytochrome c oxidase accessory protein CcoG [Jannaschia sp. W003]